MPWIQNLPILNKGRGARTRLLLAIGLVSAWLIGLEAGAAQDESSEARRWLIPARGERAAATLSKARKAVAAAPVERFQKDDVLGIRFRADGKALLETYALRLEGEFETLPAIWINGRSLDVDPVPGEDGLYYRLKGNLLVEGENTLEIQPPDGELSSVIDVEAFSLADPLEEDYFNLAFGPAIVFEQPPTDPSQDQMDVQHYDLEIVLDMSSTTVDATLTMTAESLDGALDTAVLDLNDNGGQMVVSWVDQGPSTAPLSFTHNGASERVFVTLPAAVPAGATFTVRLRYGGIPSTEGAVFGSIPYRVSTHNSTPVLYTISQPYNARCWWPCKDVPADKATLAMHITCPDAYIPVSNGGLDSIVNHGDGTHTYHWIESYPIVTYLVSLACTNYQVSSGTYTAQDGLTTMEVAHYLYPENYALESNAINGTLDVLDYFSQLFGEYPFLTEKYTTATWGNGFGMEHQTATSLPGGELDEEGYGRRNVHELAHMWFGDAVALGHYDHLWLNEGFATYSEALWDEHAEGTAAYHSTVNGWSTHDTYPLVGPRADEFNGYIVYRKGGWVLHMLRHVVEYYTGDDEDFFDAVRVYYQTYEHGNALSDDLKNVFEAQIGVDFDYFFDEWLYRAVRPTYQWAWSARVSGASTYLDLYVHQTQSGGPYTMPLDFEVENLGGSTQIVKVFNDQQIQQFEVDLGPGATPVQVTFDPDRWILKNATQITEPVQPVIRSVLGAGSDTLVVSWLANVEPFSNGYELYRSSDLSDWTLVAGTDTLPLATTSYSVSGLTPGEDVYFRLRAMSDTRGSGDFSDVYGGAPASGPASVLIVEGYDRWDTQSGRGGSFEGAFYHGAAVAESGAAFDTCDNDAVGASVTLGDYPVVVWILGEESTVQETFSSAEQALVAAYLDGGGNLLVSGAEIGWDLDREGTSEDKDFYNGSLKADYVGDAAGTSQAQGAAGSVFAAVPVFNFGTGVGHSYYIQYADRIATSGGSTGCVSYTGGPYAGSLAGIQYSGAYRLVNLGFPFETIVEQSARSQIMAAALEFFGLDSGLPSWELY